MRRVQVGRRVDLFDRPSSFDALCDGDRVVITGVCAWQSTAATDPLAWRALIGRVTVDGALGKRVALRLSETFTAWAASTSRQLSATVDARVQTPDALVTVRLHDVVPPRWRCRGHTWCFPTPTNAACLAVLFGAITQTRTPCTTASGANRETLPREARPADLLGVGMPIRSNMSGHALVERACRKTRCLRAGSFVVRETTRHDPERHRPFLTE